VQIAVGDAHGLNTLNSPLTKSGAPDSV
jgi:hypothetical protein